MTAPDQTPDQTEEPRGSVVGNICPNPNCQANTVQHGLDKSYCLTCGIELVVTEEGALRPTDTVVASLPSPADTSLATPTANPTYAQTFDGQRVDDVNTEPVPGDAPPGPAPHPGDVQTLEDTEAAPGVPTPSELDAGAVDETALPVSDGAEATAGEQPVEEAAPAPVEEAAQEPAVPTEEETHE